MRTWLAVAAVVGGGWGCSSALTPPGPGQPDEVLAVRLFDGAGVEEPGHVFLYRSETVHIEVRMYGNDGRQITGVPGGQEVEFDFVPDSLATGLRMPGDPMRVAVSTTMIPGTSGDLYVTLRFLQSGSTKRFGPFQCLVH